MNLNASPLVDTPAQLDKNQMFLWAPAVDGILRRFNEDATRAEAALSAAYLLQAMRAIGVFNPPAKAPSQATYVQPSPNARPVLRNRDLEKQMEDVLKDNPPAPMTRTYGGGPDQIG